MLMKPIAAKLVIWFSSKHDLMLIVRSDKYWTLPGGKIETNEHPIYTLKREIREELGISLSDFILDGDRSDLVRCIDDKQGEHYVALFYAECPNNIHIKALNEIVEFKWVPIKGIRQYSEFWDSVLNSQLGGLKFA